ncbi:hypothetical protein THSYN_15560 [Candidatus Thiodictyon syntrophicum]|uniref:Uncharacterized protein n=1 Tax=Candidatus Thiodictyon syntrophicum TaxID=1166950 RepID=A0A2K8U9J3_9GAMM|nr:hypothetical protein THSYN_15560 [Candidatus Thiodictyon syntrophicum]
MRHFNSISLKFQQINDSAAHLDHWPRSESTKWTSLSDLNRGRFSIRPQGAMNYTTFDLQRLARVKEVKSIPMQKLDGTAADGSGWF